jgi:hypothetical protein
VVCVTGGDHPAAPVLSQPADPEVSHNGTLGSHNGTFDSSGEWARPRVAAIAAGTGIGILLCVLNVLVLFRSGTSFGGSALVAVLGAALLRLAGALSWQALFVVFSIASSGYVATAALDTGVGSVLLQTGALPSWALLLALALVANLAGIGLGTLTARALVITEKLPYPTLKPAITLMRSLSSPDSAERRPGRTLPIAAAIGAAVAAGAAAWGRDTTPSLFSSGTHVALAISPLLFGVGFLIGHRACLWLAVGAAYSLAIWDAQGPAGASYTDHLYYPWVLAVGVGVILGYSLSSIVRITIAMRKSLGERAVIAAAAARNRPRMLAAGAVIAVAAVIAAVAVPGALKPALIALLALFLLAILTVFMNRAGGEIGIVPLAPALYFSVAVFALAHIGSEIAVLTAATICCAAVASVYFTYSAKVAHERPPGLPEPPRRLVTWTQVIGGVAGSVVGVAVVVILAHGRVIGTSSFPAPVATAVRFVDSAIRGSTSYPSSVGLALAIATPAGAALTFTPVLPTMLGLGVLLPPAYSLTISAGGLTQWLLVRRNPERRSWTEIVASGLIIGEGLVMVGVLVVQEVLR